MLGDMKFLAHKITDDSFQQNLWAELNCFVRRGGQLSNSPKTDRRDPMKRILVINGVVVLAVLVSGPRRWDPACAGRSATAAAVSCSRPIGPLSTARTASGANALPAPRLRPGR